MKQTGYVKWYDYTNGYGFTTEDVFIHFSELKDGVFLQLNEGDCIEFDLEYIRKDKPKATNVRLIS